MIHVGKSHYCSSDSADPFVFFFFRGRVHVIDGLRSRYFETESFRRFLFCGLYGDTLFQIDRSVRRVLQMRRVDVMRSNIG